LNKVAKSTPKEGVVEFLDKMKKISFDYVTHSGISISPFELGEIIPSKSEVLSKYRKKIDKVNEFLAQGFYNEDDSRLKKITI